MLAFRPRLAEINARIEQLGPPPAEGQPPEPDIVTAERQALIAEKAEINAVLGLPKHLSIRVNGLIDQIAELRRELFRHVLTKRYALTDAFGSALGVDVQAECAELLPDGLVLAALRRPVQVPVGARRHILRAWRPRWCC